MGPKNEWQTLLSREIGEKEIRDSLHRMFEKGISPQDALKALKQTFDADDLKRARDSGAQPDAPRHRGLDGERPSDKN